MADPIMHRLRGKLRRRKREAADERLSRRKVRKARRAAAGLEARIAKHQARRKGLDHVSVLDGTPCALGLKLALLDARRNGGWDGVLNSGDRRSIPFVARLLHRLGKSTQAELYQGWVERRHGFYPANPPDRGSHQRLGDGTVGELFEDLAWWRQGLDTSFATQLREVLARLGYKAYRPYSGEEWHTNLTLNPHDNLIARGQV